MNTLEQRVHQRCQRDQAGRLVYFPIFSRYGHILETDADLARLVSALRQMQAVTLMVLGVCLSLLLAMLGHVRIPVDSPWAHLIKPVLAVCLVCGVYGAVRAVMLRTFPRSDAVYERPGGLQRPVHVAVPCVMWVFCVGMVWVTVVQWADPIGVRVTNIGIVGCVLGLAVYYSYLAGLATRVSRRKA